MGMRIGQIPVHSTSRMAFGTNDRDLYRYEGTEANHETVCPIGTAENIPHEMGYVPSKAFDFRISSRYPIAVRDVRPRENRF